MMPQRPEQLENRSAETSPAGGTGPDPRKQHREAEPSESVGSIDQSGLAGSAILAPTMRDELSLDEIAMLASASESPIKDRLIAATRGRPDHVRVLRPFAASAAIDTYRVHLKLWQDDQLPPITGLPEFVAALERAGQSEVVMSVYEQPERRFVCLLSADLRSLLAAVEIAAPANSPPDFWLSPWIEPRRQPRTAAHRRGEVARARDCRARDSLHSVRRATTDEAE